MDAVLARRETEEGTESDDLLLQQAETEERQTDGRNAEESEDRREQAHGPSVSPERLSPPREPHPPRQNGGGPRPFPYWRVIGEFHSLAGNRRAPGATPVLPSISRAS